VNFTASGGDSGVATNVARGDHVHDAQYLSLVGGTLTGALTGATGSFSGSTTGSAGVLTVSQGSTGLAIRATGGNTTIEGTGTLGVRGAGNNVGVQGDATTFFGTGVLGNSTDPAGTGAAIHGHASSSNATAGRFDMDSASGRILSGRSGVAPVEVFRVDGSGAVRGMGFFDYASGRIAGLLPNCTANQVMKMNPGGTNWQCDNDATSGGGGGGDIDAVLTPGGSGLLGGASSGSVSLSIDSSIVPLLNASNSFSGNQTIAGTLTSTATFDGAAATFSNPFGGGFPIGVKGTVAFDNGYGVWGENTGNGIGVRGTTGFGTAVVGTASGPGGLGVLGEATSSSAISIGVRGVTASIDAGSNGASGVLGLATDTTGGAVGVTGASLGTFGIGVVAQANATTGTARGLSASTSADNGKGIEVQAITTSTVGTPIGIHSTTHSSTSIAGVFQNAAGGRILQGLTGAGAGTEVFRVDGVGQVFGSTFVHLPTNKNVGLRLDCSSGQIMKYNGTIWQCDADVGGAGSGDVTDVLAGTGISVTNGAGPAPTVAIDTAVVPRLSAANSFTGSNTFSGPTTLSNATLTNGPSFPGGATFGLPPVMAGFTSNAASSISANSSGAPLTITQTGSGRGLFVESTHPSTGNVTLEATSASSQGTGIQATGNVGLRAIANCFSCAAGSAIAGLFVNNLGVGKVLSAVASVEAFRVAADGTVSFLPLGTATSATGFGSAPHDYVASAFSSTTSLASNQTFRWQAQPVNNNTSSPSAKLSLLFGAGAATPTATGLEIAPNGIITFAAGQTFPGGGGDITDVNTAAGSGLQGGVTTGAANLSLITSCADGQVLQWTSPNWACATVSGAGDLTDVIAGTGITVTNGAGPAPTVAINTAVVPQLSTLNTFTAGQVVSLTGGGNAISASSSGSNVIVATANASSSNAIRAIGAANGVGVRGEATNTLGGTGLLGEINSTAASSAAGDFINQNAAGNIVRFRSGAGPTEVARVDGSGAFRAPSYLDYATGKNVGLLLTCAAGQVMQWNGADWVCATVAGSGDITDVLAGTGITVTNPGGPQPTVSANFTAAGGDNGSATTVARGDHLHDARYLMLTGGTLTGALSGTTGAFSGSAATQLAGTTSASGGAGVSGSSTHISSGTGVLGSGISFGVRGTTTGSLASTAGVKGETSVSNGVFGSASSVSGIGVRGEGADTAILGQSNSSLGPGTGVRGTANSTSSGTGVRGEATHTSGGMGVFGLANSSASAAAGGVFQNTNSSGKLIRGLNSSGTEVFAVSQTGVITGNGSSLTNVNATTLGGVPSSSFARNDLSNTFLLGQTFNNGFSANASSSISEFSGGSALTVSSSGTNGIGVSSTGSHAGVIGTSSNFGGASCGSLFSPSGFGVCGSSSSGPGIFGETSDDIAVYGEATSTFATTFGLYGVSNSQSGTGVRGVATNFSGTTYGVYGTANSPDGFGLGTDGNARVEGLLRSGSETGTTDAPAITTGGPYRGLVMRLVNSTSTFAGSVIARTDNLTLERDGTTGGLRAASTSLPSSLRVGCTGMAGFGGFHGRSVMLNSFDTQTLVFDGDGAVFLECTLGDPDNQGHFTKVTLHRTSTSDFRWIGILISTFNQ
jgi:hypothetical protein